MSWRRLKWFSFIICHGTEGTRDSAYGDKTYNHFQNPQEIAPFSVTERHNQCSSDPELLQYENIDKTAVKGNTCLVKNNVLCPEIPLSNCHLRVISSASRSCYEDIDVQDIGSSKDMMLIGNLRD